jgi:hypothetical protein
VAPTQHSALPDVAAPVRQVITPSTDPQSIAAEAFAREILRLSADADRVDTIWQIYKDECKVKVSRSYDFGREWFSLWDGTAEATAANDSCKETPFALFDAAETIRRDLLHARAMAQETGIGTGTEVGVLRWHTLQYAKSRER